MANHKSAIKRNRQNIATRERNRNARTAVRTTVKYARQAIETGDTNKTELLRRAESQIASAAKKGLYHPKAAARKISRLAKLAAKTTKAK